MTINANPTVDLPPGIYRFERQLDLGVLSLREGREFVVSGTLGAPENDALKLFEFNILRQDPLAVSTAKRD